MDRELLQRLIQLFLDDEFPFVKNNYPLGVEYDGITLSAKLSLVVGDEFMRTHLSSWCINDNIDLCNNFTMDLKTFNMCSETPIDFMRIKKIVTESFILIHNQFPHLSDIDVNFIVVCDK